MQKYKQESKQFNSNRQKKLKSINYSTKIQPHHCALIPWPEATKTVGYRATNAKYTNLYAQYVYKLLKNIRGETVSLFK